MTVTKIERQKRHPERVNLYIDGTFAFGLDEEVLVKFGLRKGDKLDEQVYRSLLKSEEYDRAKQKALNFLSYRMRTEKEIRSKLIEKEFPPEVIDQVVDHLKRLQLVNDRQFAEAFVRDAQIGKPTGARLIRQKLRIKGVAPAIIDEVVNEATLQNDEQDKAFRAAEKVIGRYQTSSQGIEQMKERQRLAAFLARRGFDWSVISPVLQKFFK